MGKVSPDAIRRSVLAQRPLVESLFDRLAVGSRAELGITRDTYGPGENFGHRVVSEQAARAGLEIRTDAAANTYMTMPGRNRAAPRILIGSHLDSVPQGGNFDGAAGVVAGLAGLAALADLGLRPACDVTVMGIRAEESVWFEVSYIGSRSALGTLPKGALEAKRVDTQRTLADHMVACGADPEAIRRGERSLDPVTIRAFLELHIEQAPSLVEAGKPIAIATAIPGNFRYPNARVVGRYDHVGTPRRFRRDAATAASDFAMALDRLWQENEAAGIPMAVTLGRFHTDPALHGLTTVAGEFRFSLDVRAYEQAVLDGLEARMLEHVRRIEEERQVRFVLGPRAQASVGMMSPEIAAALERGATELGIPAMRLGSPASHDAAAFAAAGVPVGMIFIRNENGSHNPLERMTIEDFLDGTGVLASWVASEVREAE